MSFFPKIPTAPIINVQYILFLGVILGHCFYVDNSIVPHELAVITTIGRPEFFIFCGYFVCDWLMVNIPKTTKEDTSSQFLFLQIAWVGVLGITILLLNTNCISKFAFISMYIIISNACNFYTIYSLDSNFEKRLGQLSLCIIKILLGCFFSTPLLIYCFLERKDILEIWDDPNSLLDILFWMALLYFALKATRYFLELYHKDIQYE